MSEPLLTYDRVQISYNGVPAVHDISFSVAPGEILGIVGESGSGKSTIIKAAMGQLGAGGMVTRGDIWYRGKSIPDLPPRQLRGLCGADFAMVFQDCLAALTPIRTIGDQIHEFMAAHGAASRKESDARAADLFAQLNLDDPRRVLESYPFELSGGMGQRVGLAIALLDNPRVLLADEPTSALDVVAQAQVMRLLARIREDTGAAVLLVTHNMGVVHAIADTVLVLKDGRMVEYGDAGEVLAAPAQEYTRQLVDATPKLGRTVG